MAKKADDKAKKETAKKPAKETKAKKANKKSKVSGSASADDDIPVTQETVKSAKRLPMMIHAQYVKDISFENPNAPFTLLPGQGRPEMDVNFSMDARKMDVEQMGAAKAEIDNLYEVILGVTIHAEKGGRPAFVIEIEYGMSVSLNNIPEEQHHSLLLIEMPKYMFPFVRQLVTDLSGQGGYTPLMLAPVNFSKFYLNTF